MSGMLFHGGAPGFKVGQVVLPHPTKHADGCEWCASGADDNHMPDRVFATPVRLYAKHYASKWGMGWLYEVRLEGDVQRSEVDSFESYAAERMVIVRVCERAVVLTWSERRRLYRMWTDADRAAGKPEPSWQQEQAMRRLMGFAR